MSSAICHVSYVPCPISHVTCLVSVVACPNYLKGPRRKIKILLHTKPFITSHLSHKHARKLASRIHVCQVNRLYIGKSSPAFRAVCLVAPFWSHPSSCWRLSGGPSTGHTAPSLAHFTISTRVANKTRQARLSSTTHSHNAVFFPKETTILLEKFP